MSNFSAPLSLSFCKSVLICFVTGWVNRFANAGDTAIEIAENTAYRLKQAKTEIVSASRVAYRFLAGVGSNNSNVAPDSPGNSNGGSPRFQAAWLKNLISPGAKPSTGSKVENQDQDVIVTSGPVQGIGD
ncbi:hypothetical protein Salat_0906800 [Sesamum alatum]|uniref:Uncharacterized protein n=1 Tax=Sesamum alatum TaxID=300844 RepID=A0AAE2CR58_9LAMI|nr:hypothetical protein Salat_0906800 [Sesamum alatum]